MITSTASTKTERVRVLVASIPNTGTRFCSQHLLDGGRLCSVESMHIENRYLQTIKALLKTHHCLVPMRHPWEVALSWQRRGRKAVELWDDYRRLITVIDPLKPHYLPIDRPVIRDQYLSLFNELTGLEARTHWPIVESCGIGGHTLVRNNETAVMAIMAEFSDFFARFGYYA